MADCARYRDMISGFTDGELTDTEKAEVEKHLAECASCRSLLSAYRSITESMEDETEEPPADFTENVMARIGALTENTVVETSRSVRVLWKRAVITVAAAAACLGLVFATAPLLRNMTGSTKMTASAENAPQAAASAAASAVSSSPSPAAFGTDQTGSMKSAVPSKQESAPTNDSTSEPKLMKGSGAASGSGAVVNGPTPAPSSASAASSEDRSAASDAPDASPKVLRSAVAEPDPSASSAPAAGAEHGAVAASSELEKYCAVITVKGPLPDILKGETMKDNGDGTYSIEISAQLSEQLLKDAAYQNHTGNKNAQMALVIYIPG